MSSTCEQYVDDKDQIDVICLSDLCNLGLLQTIVACNNMLTGKIPDVEHVELKNSHGHTRLCCPCKLEKKNCFEYHNNGYVR